MALVRGIQSVLVAVIAFVVALAALAVPAEAAPARSIDVLGFQDAHEFEPQTWKDGHEYGGIARLATVLAAACAEDPHAITAFGGDHPRASALGQHRARQLARPLTVLSTLWVNSPLIGPMELEIKASWRL